jgi:hypothetical protein
MNWTEVAVWLVVEVASGDVVDLGGKVKFPRGTVVTCGTREEATRYLVERAPGHAVHGGTSTSGDRGTSTSGGGGTSTSGDGGTSTSGDGGTSTSGDRGTSTSGDGGTSTSGYRGTSTSGYRGTSTSGDGGTSTSGGGGTSTSGDGGTIVVQYWDAQQGRYRLAIGEIDGDRYLAGKAYCVRDGVLVPAGEDSGGSA